MDQGICAELQRLWLVGLAAADNYRAGLGHTAEIALLVRLRLEGIVLEMLESDDWQIPLGAQAGDLRLHPVVIAGYCAEVVGSGLSVAPALAVAADEGQAVSVVL